MPYSLLVVDGDAAFGTSLAAFLKREFTVERCALAQQALDLLRKSKPDLMVLDPDLPDMGGMTLLSALRDMEAGRELPVILMSRTKTEEQVVAAFELGVDDFLVKPVDPRELLVRARAVLRRRFERVEHWGAPLSSGGVEIDPSQRSCVVRGKHVSLQPREFELLEIMMRKAGRVLTRAYLLETVWGMSSGADTRAVDVMVSRLRKRLGASGKRIGTVSKMGYSFVNPDAV